MDLNYNYFIDQTGKRIVVKDATLWGEGEDPVNRADYALLTAVVKFKRGSDNYFLDPTNGYSSLSYSPDFTNETKSVFKFDVLEDGYHIIMMLPIVVDDSSATANGSLYFNSTVGIIYIMNDGDWEPVTRDDIFTQDTDGVKPTKVSLHPYLEKNLDRIWKRYEENAFPKEGKDYKNFYLGYGMLIGAVSSMKQGNMEEYDRKISLANKMSKRWI